MVIHTASAKLLWIGAVAAAAATPVVTTGIAVSMPTDISAIVVALITGLFGTIQIYMIARLHKMVDGQQTVLNNIARADAIKAGAEIGKAEGIMAERTRADAQKVPVIPPITIVMPEKKKEE